LLINIRKDAEFFEQHDIIDYSLLIGVIRKSDRESDFSDARNLDFVEEEDLHQCKESKVYLSAGVEENL